MPAVALLCSLAVVSCGGGIGGSTTVDMPSADVAAGDARRSALSAGAAALLDGTVSSPTPRRTTEATRLDGAGDPLLPGVLVDEAALMTHLGVPSAAPDAGTRAVVATSACQQGFAAPADLVHGAAAPLPDGNGGVFYNATELATWRVRTQLGPFLRDGDFAPASPGDWARIQANAALFDAQGEPLSAADDSFRARHGQLARDAAFAQLVAPNAKRLDAVRRWLLEQAALPANDFASRLCFQYADGTSRDGYFAEAPWLARFAATYDFVRRGLAEADRVTLENYLRRHAWFFAAQLDWGLRAVFPQRLEGDYRVRGDSAAATGDAVWWTRRTDGNGDCRIDDGDDPAAYPTYTHANADGSLGPKVSVLAMWFNNRRAANALAAGTAGVLLGDAELQHRAKRYVMEWLTYGAFGDGSVSEYTRNGEYCVNRQGLVYGSMNVEPAVMLARLFARQGDRSLADFATSEGLFGSASKAGEPPKSLSLVSATLLDASTGKLDWYRAEPQRGAQQPRPATALGQSRERYMGGAPMRLMHELGLLPLGAALPRVPVAATMLAHPLLQQASTEPVETGLGRWSDALGILPAAYLMRP